MKPLLTAKMAQRLREVAERFRTAVPMPEPDRWRNMSDGQLWLAVLRQLAVVGRAAAAEALTQKIEPRSDFWYSTLAAASATARRTEMHRQLRSAGVRYVERDSAKCKKTAAADYNFELLRSYGGPKSYFTSLAAVPHESWRISIISDDLAYIKNKGARDLLIDLGLVRDAIALDSRLQGVLRSVGVDLPDDVTTNKLKYRSLERELLEKVCGPCSMSGGHFDRIHFKRWKDVA
jgi:hypothetical protein